jgi:ABC-type tungstate transport system substrate-binding protein
MKMKSLIKIILGSKRVLKSKGEVDPGIVLGLILTLIAIGLFIWFVVKNMGVVQQ